MTHYPSFITRCCLPALLSLAAAGCQQPLPAGYVQVEPGWERTFRAVSAEGAAFTLRTETNPKNGDLVFWEKAISSRLVEIRGYQLAGRREVKHKTGTPGIEMTYDYKRDGVDYAYLLTVFVRGDKVYVFEGAGTKAQMATDMPKIQQSIQAWLM